MLLLEEIYIHVPFIVFFNQEVCFSIKRHGYTFYCSGLRGLLTSLINFHVNIPFAEPEFFSFFSFFRLERVLSLENSLKEWCCVVFHAKKHYAQCHGLAVVTLTWSQTIFSVLEKALLGIGRGFTLLGINSVLLKLQIGRMFCIFLEMS